MRALITLAILCLGGHMVPIDAATDRADQIFRIGPETLVAAAPVIVAGRVSHYHKEILKLSQPGPDGFALQWRVTAELAAPATLKGSPLAGPISFTRVEHSFMSPVPTQNARWEQDYGELVPDGTAVLFLSGGESNTVQKVLPSGDGEQDLLAMVKEIVAIQRLTEPKERIQRWLAYLGTGPAGEGYRVALRSLILAGAGWQQVQPAFSKILAQTGLSPDVRAFTFALIAFNITQNTWPSDGRAALDLLCTSFSGQTDPKLALRNLGSFSLLLDYAAAQPSRHPLRDQAAQCLRTWATRGLADQDLAQEYKRLRQHYGIQ